MYKSFQRDTLFITDQGTKTFGDFTNGQRIRVMDKDGIWRDAIVRHYKVDEMIQITLKKKEDEIQTIQCSLDHRWILENGYVTRQLSIGHKLYPFAHGMYYHITSTGSRVSDKYLWTVTDIHVINSAMACCVEEPITHSFCLDKNIVTADCY